MLFDWIRCRLGAHWIGSRQYAIDDAVIVFLWCQNDCGWSRRYTFDRPPGT